MRPFWARAPARSVSPVRAGLRRLPILFSIVRGRPGRNAVPESGYISHNADAIRLQLDGKLNLDGEILVANGRIDISASTPLDFLTL
jgi:hypothetical protein